MMAPRVTVSLCVSDLSFLCGSHVAHKLFWLSIPILPEKRIIDDPLTSMTKGSLISNLHRHIFIFNVFVLACQYTVCTIFSYHSVCFVSCRVIGMNDDSCVSHGFVTSEILVPRDVAACSNHR